MSITGRDIPQDAEHIPIIQQRAFNETEHGGWEEWSAGCICGWYKTTTSTRYIPSRQSAERLYNAHLPSFLEEEPEEIETPEEALLRWSSNFMEEVCLKID